jgi:hypothetical protein
VTACRRRATHGALTDLPRLLLIQPAVSKWAFSAGTPHRLAAGRSATPGPYFHLRDHVREPIVVAFSEYAAVMTRAGPVMLLFNGGVLNSDRFLGGAGADDYPQVYPYVDMHVAVPVVRVELGSLGALGAYGPEPDAVHGCVLVPVRAAGAQYAGEDVPAAATAQRPVEKPLQPAQAAQPLSRGLRVVGVKGM